MTPIRLAGPIRHASSMSANEGVSFVASIMTNASALTALQSLSATNRALEMTQARISTGYRVAEAADNAAYWSIATTMRSDNAVALDRPGLARPRRLEGRHRLHRDEQGARNGRQDQGQAGRRRRRQPRPTRTRSRPKSAALQKQLKSFADSATFSGANWLSVNSTVASGNPSAGVHADAQIVSSFNRDAAGNVTLGKINITVQSVKLYDAAATTAETTRHPRRRCGSARPACARTPPTAAVAGTVAATRRLRDLDADRGRVYRRAGHPDDRRRPTGRWPK